MAAGSLLVAALSVAATWTIAARSEAAAERRDAAERFRPERLAAYAAFLAYARTIHREGWTSIGSRTGVPLPEHELNEQHTITSPGDVHRRLNELAAPIRLLNPALTEAANDVIVGVTLFLVDVENGDRKLARKEDPSAELSAFEAAAAGDLRTTGARAHGRRRQRVPSKQRR